MAGPERRAEATDIPCRLNGNGSVFQLSYTTRRNLRNYHDTLEQDLGRRDLFIQRMLGNGVDLIPDCR